MRYRFLLWLDILYVILLICGIYPISELRKQALYNSCRRVSDDITVSFSSIKNINNSSLVAAYLLPYEARNTLRYKRPVKLNHINLQLLMLLHVLNNMRMCWEQ